MARAKFPASAPRTSTPPVVATPVTATALPVKVQHEQIAQRAYEKWCKRGRPHGTHLQDWLEAEKELQAELGRPATATKPRR